MTISTYREFINCVYKFSPVCAFVLSFLLQQYISGTSRNQQKKGMFSNQLKTWENWKLDQNEVRQMVKGAQDGICQGSSPLESIIRN